ncbi:hypothetical protein [Microbacterium sp. PAMC21962]|uniref:hypothetical protein n=1 Tax=Microbacterium sp. PAMC21962 TaxID=2861280 RepID=UPI001C63247D|nr:hypothetical protein [Microbacterium sp. PAMC21962]QYF98434.1 hypothetical protein KY498_04105 [Microbacterium sp. PAMC21962]
MTSVEDSLHPLRVGSDHKLVLNQAYPSGAERVLSDAELGLGAGWNERKRCLPRAVRIYEVGDIGPWVLTVDDFEGNKMIEKVRAS